MPWRNCLCRPARLALALVGLMSLMACTGQGQADRIDTLEQELNAIRSEARDGPAQACRVETFTFIKRSRGDSCDTYEAWIKGWSEGCVAACDTDKRLEEAIASANVTCQEFCADRGCRKFAYDPPRACASPGCMPFKSCPANCPLLNSCYLEQGNFRWNCKCVEL